MINHRKFGVENWLIFPVGGQQLLLEICQIKSEINNLKDQVNRQGSQAENSNWRGPSYRGRECGYQPNRTSWGCQNCRGEEEMNVIIALLVVTRGMWLGNGFFSKCNFYLQDEHSHYLQY